MLAGLFRNRRFQFRPVLTVFSLAGLGVLISLGVWQLKRLEWKEGLIAKIEARTEAPPIAFEEARARAEAGEDMEYTPVKLTGRWRQNSEAMVFGSYEGMAGIYLFAPVQSVGANDLVYVNLGYLPQSMGDWPAHAPLYLTPGQTEIVGLFRYTEEATPPASWFQSTDQSPDGLWFVRDPLRFAEVAEIETSPYYIDSFAREGAKWPKGGTTRLDFRNNHLDYALTWFGLGAALCGVWLAFSLPKR